MQIALPSYNRMKLNTMPVPVLGRFCMPNDTILMLIVLFMRKNATNRVVSVLMSATPAGTHTTSKLEHTKKYRMNKLA
jgi:hypothetical protein